MSTEQPDAEQIIASTVRCEVWQHIWKKVQQAADGWYGCSGHQACKGWRTFFQRLLDLLWVMGRFHILVSGKRMTSAIACSFRYEMRAFDGLCTRGPFPYSGRHCCPQAIQDSC